MDEFVYGFDGGRRRAGEGARSRCGMRERTGEAVQVGLGQTVVDGEEGEDDEQDAGRYTEDKAAMCGKRARTVVVRTRIEYWVGGSKRSGRKSLEQRQQRSGSRGRGRQFQMQPALGVRIPSMQRARPASAGSETGRGPQRGRAAAREALARAAGSRQWPGAAAARARGMPWPLAIAAWSGLGLHPPAST